MILVLMAVTMTAGAYKVTLVKKTNCAVSILSAFLEGFDADYPEGAKIIILLNPSISTSVLKTLKAEAVGNDWGTARAASVNILGNVEIVEFVPQRYYFTMPRADVQLTVEYEVQIPAAAEESTAQEGQSQGSGQGGESQSATEGKVLSGVTMNVSVEEGSTPVTKEDGKTYYDVKVEGVNLPADAPAGDVTIELKGETMLDNCVFQVTSLAAHAFETAGEAKVAKVVMPETENIIQATPETFMVNGGVIKVEVPLSKFDVYASKEALKSNVEARAVSANYKLPNILCTFSSGIDVEVPEGVTILGAHADGGSIRLEPIEEANTTKIIKANNGVILAADNKKTINLIARSTAVAAIGNAKSYPNNDLIPVTKSTHFTEENSVLILKNREFHTVKYTNEVDRVPLHKAVMPKIVLDVK